MKKLGLKEELELEITNIKMKKIEEGKELKREDLSELSNIGAIIEDYGIPSEGEYKDYFFEIDENYNVTILDKLKGEKPTITAQIISTGSTRKAEIQVTASINEGTIKSIEATNGAILKESDENTSTKKIYKVNQNGTYYFKVTADNGRTATTSIEVQGLINGFLNGGIKFNGGTSIITNLAQTDILPNSNGEFTIAMRVKINRAEQSTVNYMGLFGYHEGSSGITSQFNATSTDIESTDYSNYYDEWTDLVYTYNNGAYRFYINGKLVTSLGCYKFTQGFIFVIGNSHESGSRHMKGSISSIKVWSKELTESEVATLNMREKYTLIQDESIKLESGLDSLEEIQKIGTMQGSNYEFLNNTWE